MPDTERMRELRAELQQLEEAERRAAQDEQDRVAKQTQQMSSAEYRRTEDRRFTDEYALNFNASLRDNYGQKIIPKSQTDRYERIRLVEAIAPAMARSAAIKYGPQSPQVTYYLGLTGADSLDAYIPPSPT